jgi:HPt (histidine-containing phosphotransfer) domain-containing protein
VDTGNKPLVETEASLSAAIDRLWARFRPEITSRVETLEAAAAALAGGALNESQRHEAQAAAHKLAGTLGTFSLARGTQLARELESIYTGEGALDASAAERLAAMAVELRALINNRK